MSVYTDYLNDNFVDLGNAPSYTDFLRVCAWSQKQLEPFRPEKLEPIGNKFVLDIDAMNDKLDAEMDKLQYLEAATPAEQEQERDTQYEAVEAEREQNIIKTSALLEYYGDLLEALCLWTPVDPQMKSLKDFAIKELVSNLPDPTPYKDPSPKQTVTAYVDAKRKEYTAAVNALTKEITTKSKQHIAANDYLDILFSETNYGAGAEETDPTLL